MPNDIPHQRAWVVGLAVECPMGEALPNCIMKSIRSIPLADAYKVVQDLPESEIEKIFKHHKNCLAEREQWDRLW